jgi:hypothetical protein
MPRFYVEIGGLKARPEHIAAGLVCVALPFWLKKSEVTIRWIVADYFLAAYIVLNMVSSVFTSIAPGQTTKWAMQQVVVILPYFLLRALVNNTSAFRRAFQIILAVGACESAYAILCFFSNLLFGTKFGMEIGQYDAVPGTFGTQYEANILGAYCGACSIMMLAMYLKEPGRKYLFGFAVTFVAMAISLSRAVLLATSFTFVVLLIYGMRRRLVNRRILVSIATTMLCITMVLVPVLLPIYAERFRSLEVSDIAADDTTKGRLLPIFVSMNDVFEHPIVGNGTSSFQLTFNYAEIDPNVDAGWISNTELRVLHDTGVAGLGVFMVFLVLLAVGARKVLKRKSNPELMALVFAGLVYCISFQATEGTLLAFTWVHLGLIGCALSIYKWSDETSEHNAKKIAAV